MVLLNKNSHVTARVRPVCIQLRDHAGKACARYEKTGKTEVNKYTNIDKRHGILWSDHRMHDDTPGSQC
jgi:hypothetical protein